MKMLLYKIIWKNRQTSGKSLYYYIDLLTVKGMGLYVNIDKTEFMYYTQDGAISLLNGKPLKLVDQFRELSKNI